MNSHKSSGTILKDNEYREAGVVLAVTALHRRKTLETSGKTDFVALIDTVVLESFILSADSMWF